MAVAYIITSNALSSLFETASPPDHVSGVISFDSVLLVDPPWERGSPELEFAPICHRTSSKQPCAVLLVFLAIQVFFTADGALVNISGIFIDLATRVIDFVGATSRNWWFFDDRKCPQARNYVMDICSLPGPLGKFDPQGLPRDLPRQPSTPRRLGDPQLWPSMGCCIREGEGEG